MSAPPMPAKPLDTTPFTYYESKPRWAWMWLMYTGFLFIEPIMIPSMRLWLETMAVFGIFVLLFALYIHGSTCSGRRRMSIIGAIMLLGVVTFPWNPGGSTFFVYVASFLPFTIKRVRTVLLLFAAEAVIIAALAVAPHHLWPQHFRNDWPNAIMAVFLMVLIGGGNIFFAEQRRAEHKLRAAQEENITLAAVAERERIARDLHDVLGHTLSVIVLKAELAGRLIERDPARAASEIGDVERTARTALAEVRETIGGYRERGLLAELENARRCLDAAGVQLQCDAAPAFVGKLRAQEETVLALALREAVTNIIRHARATTCTLRFGAENGEHRLMVEDNGERLTDNAATFGEGNGLRGMRERVEALGGSVLIERSAGTRLRIALPLQEATS